MSVIVHSNENIDSALEKRREWAKMKRRRRAAARRAK